MIAFNECGFSRGHTPIPYSLLPIPCRGPHELGVPNERFLLVGVKGQVFVAGVASPCLYPPTRF
jgi:hypothetical protein